MKKIIAAVLLLAFPIICNSGPEYKKFWITSLNKTEASVRAVIDKPFPSIWDMEGMGGVTWHINQRNHRATNFPFTMKYIKSTGHMDEYTVIIGKEYEAMGCDEYEFTIEIHEGEHPAITYAGCKKL